MLDFWRSLLQGAESVVGRGQSVPSVSPESLGTESLSPGMAMAAEVLATRVENVQPGKETSSCNC